MITNEMSFLWQYIPFADIDLLFGKDKRNRRDKIWRARATTVWQIYGSSLEFVWEDKEMINKWQITIISDYFAFVVAIYIVNSIISMNNG